MADFVKTTWWYWTFRHLLGFFPHDHVEVGAVLVTEDKAGVVIVLLVIHVKCAAEVHPTEVRET